MDLGRVLGANRGTRCGRNFSLPLFVLLVLVTAGTRAQTPTVDVNGLPVEPLIGEQFCIDADFTNTAAPGTTGYGPYLVVILDPGMTDAQVDFVDIPPNIEYVGEFGPDGELVDPVSGQTLTGEEGSSLYIARYPVGSVNPGDPALIMDACGVLQPGVEIGVPLNVTIIPGFEFGDTATGDNGAILDTGDTFTGTVTPQLARVQKDNTAPEGERPPGPGHPFNYVWTVDVSDQVTIDNVVLADDLPDPQIQWTGDPITVEAPGGDNCQVSTEPNLPETPGGLVEVSCDAVTGSAGSEDIVVTVPVYITDILDEAAPDSEPITNTVTFDYGFDGDAYSNTDDSEVLALHAAIQKSVSGGNLPGDMVDYAIDFQITDYPGGAGNGANTFVITDVMPDGLEYLDTVELVVGGQVTPITADVSPDTPGPGQTTLIWDVEAAAGGLVADGDDGVLRYQAQILESYADGTPVSSEDELNNTANLSYILDQGGSGENGTSGSVVIPPNVPEKIIIDPDDGSEIMPGQEVTFRLTMVVPAGNTGNVTFTDVLPSPVFDVTDPEPTVVVPPDPQFYQPPTAPAVSFNAANNTVVIEFGDINTNEEVTLAVDLTATVTDDPFADNLYLTNLLVASYENSDEIISQTVQAVALLVGAPQLQITKGVLDTDNPGAEVVPAHGGDPAAELIDSDAQGVDNADVVNYVLTVENVGGQPAYNVVITDPLVTGIDNCSVSGVTNGNGDTLDFSGDLETGLALTDPLEGNDENPAGGGAPFADDTALVQVQCTLDTTITASQEIVNTASATWTATAGSTDPFPAVEDDATLVAARPALSKAVTNISPGYGTTYNASGVHVGEVIEYTLTVDVPELVYDQSIVDDLLDAGLSIHDRNGDTTVDGDDITINNPADVTSATNTVTVTDEGGGNVGVNRRLNIDLGQVTNNNTDNGTAEQVTIIYEAKVNNSSGNVNNQQRNNQASWSWFNADGVQESEQASAPPVTILEPQLQVTKSLDISTGDGTSQPVVTLEIRHAGGSTGDAFDVNLSDILPTFTDAGGTEYQLMSLIPGTVSADGACPAFTVPPDDDSTVMIDASWQVFPLGEVCEITFQTDVLDDIPAGATITNCADLAWQSMDDVDQPADQDPLGYERTGDSADPGDLNDYVSQSCAPFKFQDVGISKSVASTDQLQTDNLNDTPAGAESLTIGEVVTFNLVVTAPESENIVDLQVADFAPVSDVKLELLDAVTQDSFGAGTGQYGAQLTPDNSDPTRVLEDTDGDGINDKATLDYGNIAHTPLDGTTDADRFLVVVTARVLDVAENANNDLSENTAQVSYQTSVDGPPAIRTDTYGVEIVEPLLQVDKTADVTTVESGNTVTYNLRISHTGASRVDAEDLALSDVLPDDMTLVPGSLATGQCSADPDTLAEAGNGISGSWASFPLGTECNITFEAEVDQEALSGSTITNVADISWTSLVGQGDADDRQYDASDNWDVVVSQPGLRKFILSTGSEDTPFTPGEPVTQLTIGETVTFHIIADMPDATTRAVTVTDLLPVDARLRVDSSEVVRIGSDLTLSSGLAVGTAGTCTSAGTYTEDCSWDLGDVVNAPDARPPLDPQDQVVFEVVATVIDDPANSGIPGVDDNVPNTARLESPDADLTAVAVLDIVEPLLEIDKFTASGGKAQAVGAGDLHRFTLSIAHTGQSSATARQVLVTDTLSPDLLWQSNWTSTCAGATLASSPAVGASGTIEFAIDSLPGGSCEISFDVEVLDSAVVPGDYPNSVTMDWASLPGDPAPADARQGSDASAALLFSVQDSSVVKEVTGSSDPNTGTAEHDGELDDGAIGEIVEYTITSYFTAGTTLEVMMLDELQQDGSGHLQYVGGEVLSVGENLSFSQTPALSFIPDPADPQSIQVDFGDVTNVGTSSSEDAPGPQDAVTFRLLARVFEDAVPTNTDGDVLTNEVDLNYALTVGGPVTTRSASAQVDVVEPVLEMTKDFTGVSDGVATVRLEVSNSGTAPAYDLEVTDDFDETLWVPGSVTPTSVPAGFTLTESGDGLMLVTLALDAPDPLVPTEDQVLEPGESVVIEFSVELVQPYTVDEIPNTAESEVSSQAGDLGDDLERSYTATAEDTLALPVLDLTKSASPAPAVPGNSITYTLVLENSGAAPATDVVVTDTPDGNGVFLAGSVAASGTAAEAGIDIGNTGGDTSVEVRVASLEPGESLTITYDVQVPSPYPDGSDTTAVPQQLENQAQAEASEIEPMLSDDPGTAAADDPTVVNIIADPIMTITKDDQVLFTRAGAVLVYAIDYANAGNQDASGVVISETVPANTTFNAGASSPGWSCADGAAAGTVCEYTVAGGVPGGEGGSLLFAVMVDASVAAGVTEIDNTIDIAEDGAEFERVDGPPSTDSADEVTPLVARPGLTITKDDGGIFVVPGQVYAYELTYTNTGSQAATGLEITETVPDFTFFNAANSTPGWSCPDGSGPGTVCILSAGSLEPGESRTARFGLRVVAPLPAGVDTIFNGVSITDDGENSPQPQTDEDTDDTPVIAAPDMAVEKSTDLEEVNVDDTVIYTIEYANLGDQDATGVIIREVVPAGAVYAAEDSAPTEWSCEDGAPAGTVCTVDIGSLAAGASGSLAFAVRVVEEPGISRLANVIEINDDHNNGPDPDRRNNTDTEVTPFPAKSIPVMNASMLILLAGALLLLGTGGYRRRGHIG